MGIVMHDRTRAGAVKFKFSRRSGCPHHVPVTPPPTSRLPRRSTTEPFNSRDDRVSKPLLSRCRFRQINSGLLIKFQFYFVKSGSKANPLKGEVDENGGLNNCLGRDAVGL